RFHPAPDRIAADTGSAYTALCPHSCSQQPAGPEAEQTEPGACAGQSRDQLLSDRGPEVPRTGHQSFAAPRKRGTAAGLGDRALGYTACTQVSYYRGQRSPGSGFLKHVHTPLTAAVCGVQLFAVPADSQLVNATGWRLVPAPAGLSWCYCRGRLDIPRTTFR